MDDKQLHALAREFASEIDSENLDKKQLRFNDIVECAKQFYPTNIVSGLKELVMSCDKTSALYIPKKPMATTLTENYGWMLT